jgi:hypothetical protein
MTSLVVAVGQAASFLEPVDAASDDVAAARSASTATRST